MPSPCTAETFEIEQSLTGAERPCVIASDYVKALPESIGRWFPRRPVALGTDGFGRSDMRSQLRRFFEVNRHYVVVAALKALAETGWYFPLWWEHVLFLHAEGGYVFENGGGLLPDYERFYLGGMNSIRGFDQAMRGHAR